MTIDQVHAIIDEAKEDLAELALHLGNTYGPVGAEATTAAAVHEWYQQRDIPSQYIEIIDGRANVVARLRGDGSGRSLIFNAHLDTEASGPDYDHLMQVADPNKVGGWREGDRLFGHTILNDRGCMAVFMIAAHALRTAGVRLAGDVIFESVAGETGQSPVDEFAGLRYEGKGFGTTYLLQHGIRANYALVAETTDFASCWYNLGAMYFKVTVRGQNMYTPRLIRSETVNDHPNAIVKAATIVQAIEAWAIEREQALATETSCGPARPKAQVGAVRGGIPWRPNRSSPYCALYVDVRTMPGEPFDDVERSLRTALLATGIDVELDGIMAKGGACASDDEIEPLSAAVAASHAEVRGEPQPVKAATATVSMWRDTNVFNTAGIPSLTYGPSRGQADVQGRGHFEIDDLVSTAKIYASIAMRVSGR